MKHAVTALRWIKARPPRQAPAGRDRTRKEMTVDTAHIEPPIASAPNQAAADALRWLNPDESRVVRPVLETLVAAFPAAPRRLHLVCDPALQLPAVTLASVGTIVGEALSNALAHAFPDGRDGDIWVRLVEADGRLTLAIRDNGVGMPDLGGGDPHTGHGLIEALARQLGGYARLGSANFGGAEVCVVFPRNA